MKPFLSILLLCLLACDARAERGVFLTAVLVEWDYRPEDLAETTFKVYGSSNLFEPMELWPVVATVTGHTWAQFDIDPVAMFYAVTATNWRGESDFSNVLRVSGPPLSDFKLRIKITTNTSTP